MRCRLRPPGPEPPGREAGGSHPETGVARRVRDPAVESRPEEDAEAAARVDRSGPPEENADPTEDPWSEFIRVTSPEFRKPTIEQQGAVTKPIWEALVGGVRFSHDRLMEIWEEVRPDVVCTDNVIGFPAVELAGCPWARFVSANPLEMRDPQLPPPLSGLPTSDPSQWRAFGDEYHRVHENLLAQHNDFRVSVGSEPCPPDEFNTHSPWPNLYLFPEVVDYPRSVRLDATWHRLQSTDGEDATAAEPHRLGAGPRRIDRDHAAPVITVSSTSSIGRTIGAETGRGAVRPSRAMSPPPRPVPLTPGDGSKSVGLLVRSAA